MGNIYERMSWMKTRFGKLSLTGLMTSRLDLSTLNLVTAIG